jgi:hypothetical protein
VAWLEDEGEVEEDEEKEDDVKLINSRGEARVSRDLLPVATGQRPTPRNAPTKKITTMLKSL